MPPLASTPAAAPSMLSSDNATAEVVPRGGSTGRVRDSFAAFAAQEKALQSDPKYRKYSQAVDKTLQSFDQVNEWADFITFLAKLLKCLQGYPQFNVIPHKLIVAKRLSQCLNPALPTGVHQRALDVYTHILTTIGPENLRRDLPAWSSGLFPFFQYAATSVKPIVLSIYERFYLPLQEALRPATKAFILALLPGLEEETGEFFEKVAALLDRVSGTVSPSFFFQNLWLVLITAPHSRIPALNYLSRRLPKMESDESLTHIVGQDVGLMIRGFAAALEDSQILVQRGILDLLTTTLKLKSVGFKSTRREDQILLMRAAVGAVLRRDLSLSRRLYTWLLGPLDASDAQVAHLREHGLDLLRAALKADMDAQSHEMDTAERQRPFKIFISLLDKWEIGAQLTEVLVLDAFEALQRSLRPTDDHDELLMTGNMLFEILDPFLLWQQIYLAVKCAAVELSRFVVRTFRLHDEEIQKLHAPFVAFGSVTQNPNGFSRSVQLAQAVSFASELLHEIPASFFAPTSDHALESPPARFGQSLADALYSAPDVKAASLPETEGRELLAAGLATALRLVEACAKQVGQSADGDAGTRELLLSAIRIVEQLAVASGEVEDELHLPWQPVGWTDSLIGCLSASRAIVANFTLHSSIIKLVLTLTKASRLRPPLRGDRRPLIEALASKLLEYLQPGCAPYFVEAVQHLWGVETLSGSRHLESMIAERLASPTPAVRLAAFEAFGNLWRFTEDAQLPGVVLRVPMFKMLDSLKAEDLATRRAAEAWMRCSLKSYIRILDPLLFTLLDPSIKLQPKLIKVADVRVPTLAYQRTFDQGRVQHVLDNLLALARFGGQGFIRIAKGSFLKHTLDPALRERVMDSNLDTMTYLDGLIAVLLRFLRADPDRRLIASLGPLNHHMHAIVAEILQVVISRGEAEISGLAAIESALMSRLFLCVHRSELDLQNKLLHVLHSVIHTVASSARRPLPNSTTPEGDSTAEENEAQPPDLTHDELFVRILSDAVSVQNNNAIIHHWVDFLLMTIPQYRQSLQTIILPLIDRFVARLQSLVTDLKSSYAALDASATSSTVTDAEYTVLVNALERLLLMAITESAAATTEDEPKSSERVVSDASSSGGSGGLLGYMSNVLSHAELESPELSEETKVSSTSRRNDRPLNDLDLARQTKHAVLQRVRDAVDLLLFSWDVTSVLDASAADDHSSSQGYFAARTKVRARRALERVYKAAPSDVLDDIVVYWNKSGAAKESAVNARIFAILHILAPAPRTVVSMLCDKLNPKQVAAVDKNKSPYAAPDDVAFAFLEAYIDRIEGPMAVQVWSTALTFVREVLGNLSANRPLIFPSLRCFTAISEKVSQTSALEDRRMRRDLQETFIRLVDASVQLAGRAVESGNWLRKATADGTTNGDTESIVSEKTKGDADSIATETDKRAPATGKNAAREITLFLAQRVLADFRRFLIDADKIVTACSNTVYYIVAPAFKTRSKSFDIDPAVFELLQEMAKNPQTVKAWRSTVADAFADNRFFNAPPSLNVQWKPLIQALMSSDKERLPDLAGKISTVSSANIFTNRELESLSRALSLRRLTYTIFTGDKDRFVTQLPIIQEKLVDLLRSSVGDMVHAEVGSAISPVDDLLLTRDTVHQVYLCLRVLFCRVGNQHLAGLWPVILTELVSGFFFFTSKRCMLIHTLALKLRLFESLVDRPVPDGSDLLQLVLSACKFLDLTLVLQTEDFQMCNPFAKVLSGDEETSLTFSSASRSHAWMFCTDTVDAIYPPDAFLPQAIIDRLGELLGGDRAEDASPSSAPPVPASARHPLLAARRISTISELVPFFTTLSLSAYESVYHSGSRVDWNAVEDVLVRDLFEG
ncbi:SPOSA6832_04666 [Sporobolomyces salmonicolor]|uniref:SPOSA6832_04666-mRNA-1:cds n=1 Tax=Sporidiobolus salmonicolor TaxID=5005 RepID=A0A0D6ESK3_SPOSA|nr:SPOSA6832_04666 [Sporobolomyces salmonicolor]